MSAERVALITGPTSGIGFSTAEAMARAGFSLVLVARRTELLERLATDLRSRFKIAVETRVVDLSEPGSAARVLTGLSRLDALVNCAGAGEFGAFEEQNEAGIARIVQLNCVSLAEICRAAFPLLKRSRGVIVNVSSLGAQAPLPYFSVYSATKAFVTNFSLALNEEWREHGIRVVSLNPSGVTTPFFETAGGPVAVLESQKHFLLSPERIARDIVRAVARPRPLVIPGPGGRVIELVLRIFSPARLAREMKKVYQPHLS